MHKRKVLSFFLLLIVFGAGLFMIQKTYFKTTGSAVFEQTSTEQIPFSFYVKSVEFQDTKAIVHIIFSSDEPRSFEIHSYFSLEGSTIAYKQDSLSVGEGTPYSIVLNLPYRVSSGTLIIYASDGNSDIKIVQNVGARGINGSVVLNQDNSSLGIGTGIIVGCIVILFVIIFGMILNRHRKQTKKVAVEANRQRFIKLDVD